ncbi:MAG: M20/M25/M40 family metallo-hydrolase [bacterium]|nr:M20/M25/M40 family metallo-hydrolase [bacterium]
MKARQLFSIVILIILFSSAFASAQIDENVLVGEMHKISSARIMDYIRELADDKYGGRLTGAKENQACLDWMVEVLKNIGVKPGGDDNTFYQKFPHPYTLVYPDCSVSLHIDNGGETYRKDYRYFDEFIPGGTTADGEVTAEVIYVGYGITAPELGFDEYSGVDVRGKIVLLEREAPVSPRAGKETFMKWRPYSFHQYKLENAVRHGAAGMLYNYGPIGNPNNSYAEGFVYSHVGDAVMQDAFSGTGRNPRQTVREIQDELKPRSFATGKTFTVKNSAKHFPDGIGENLVGIIEGTDSSLKDEFIMVGGHQDHLGRLYDLMPGANDNASAAAIMFELAERISESPIKPRRSIMFMFFGAEEQGVRGSEYYVQNPLVPIDKTVALLNMDAVGCGEGLRAGGGGNYPSLMNIVNDWNNKFVHRNVSSSYSSNLGRPRLDAAHFFPVNIPTLSFGGTGSYRYHTPADDISYLNPELMEDLAEILFLSIMDIANRDQVDFRKDAKRSLY